MRSYLLHYYYPTITSSSNMILAKPRDLKHPYYHYYNYVPTLIGTLYSMLPTIRMITKSCNRILMRTIFLSTNNGFKRITRFLTKIVKIEMRLPSKGMDGIYRESAPFLFQIEGA